MKVFKQYRELTSSETIDSILDDLIIGSTYYIKDNDDNTILKYVVIPLSGYEDKVGQKYNSTYSVIAKSIMVKV